MGNKPILLYSETIHLFQRALIHMLVPQTLHWKGTSNTIANTVTGSVSNQNNLPSRLQFFKKGWWILLGKSIMELFLYAQRPLATIQISRTLEKEIKYCVIFSIIICFTLLCNKHRKSSVIYMIPPVMKDIKFLMCIETLIYALSNKLLILILE